MPPCMNVIHDTFFNVKRYPMNYQSKKNICPFLTFFEGICVRPKHGDHFMFGGITLKTSLGVMLIGTSIKI